MVMDGPFVTVVSVDGGSLSGNKLTVKTPAPSPTMSSTSDSPEPVTLPCTSPGDQVLVTTPVVPEEDRGGGGAYVTVVALGKDKKSSGENNTSVVNILNEVEECLKENFPEFFPLLEQKRKTVVSIEDVEENVVIYRLPGERLGLALRFEGGEDPAVPINRLFIDSCTEGSPAGKAVGSWGHLSNGDEVLEVGGLPVSFYSRQQLIDTLRESPVALTLKVRHVMTLTPPLNISPGTPRIFEATSEQLLNQLTETLPMLHQESILNTDWRESSPNWSPIEDDSPVPPPRRIAARDSIKSYRNQRPLSLHLDPPYGFEDFQLRLRTLSLESLPSTVMRSRSSVGRIDSPLEPPLLFQDLDDFKFPYKKVVTRSRSLVNISHEEAAPESPDHPDEKCTGDIELNRSVEDPDRTCVSPDFTEVEEGSDDSSGGGSVQTGSSGDDGEVTIRIEWLHEIQEEPTVSGLPSHEERTSDEVQLTAENNFNLSSITDPPQPEANIDTVLDKILEQKDLPFVLPVKDDTEPLTHLLSTPLGPPGPDTGGGMDTAFDLGFLPPPTHARLPPDGHESPNVVNNNWAEQNYTPPPLPDSQPPEDDPPPLPTSGPPNIPTKTVCRITTHTGNDEVDANILEQEPSIKSVKDKIALFSSTAMIENEQDSKPLNNNSLDGNNSLLEERRKSICRLRGLVLADKPATSPLLELPTIRSKDAPLITSIIPKIQNVNRHVPSHPQNREVRETTPELQNPWRSTSALPKYSPAFKRRTLAPYVPPKPHPRQAPPAPPIPVAVSVYRSVITSSTEDLDLGDHAPSPVPTGKEESESDKDSAVPSSPPSSLPQEITPSSSPLPQEDESETNVEYVDSHDEVEELQSPLQAIFDMEAQMAYINEICDALPSSGGEFFHKRRDSEATVIERPITITPLQPSTAKRAQEVELNVAVAAAGPKERETKSPGREIQSLTKETQRASQCSQGSGHAQVQQQYTSAVVFPKVTGILEKKIERIIEKTTSDSRARASTTSIPRGRNDFKSLAEKWQQISTQEKNLSQGNCSNGKPLFTTQPHARTTRALSVTDIRKTFEKSEEVMDFIPPSAPSSTREDGKGSPPELLSPPSAHFRVSSFDSTTSEESSTPGTSFMSSVPRDPYGSITSLASSTSLISPQELQQLIEEANQSLEEAGTPTHEVNVVILHREFAGGSLGITLAGGADYETKEITVHKVLSGSIADRDGRIYRGDRCLSINGKNTKGLTHRDALNLLKAPRCEVVLVVSRGRTGSNSFSTIDETMVCLDRAVEPLLNGTIPITTYENDDDTLQAWGPTKTVILVKDGAGLGFSLDGGKGSILGDKALTIKKIFVGGPAEKSRGLAVGDLITAINGTKMNSKSRTEAWNFMKKLGDGEVRVSVRSPIQS